MGKRSYLRRYTHLESLRNILCTKSLTLLDYRGWDDKNDSCFLRLYREERKLESLLALCFTRASERFHFWHVFCPHDVSSIAKAMPHLNCGSYKSHSPLTRIGVRIRFDRAKLVQALRRCEGVACRNIDYMTHGQLETLANERRGTDPLSKLPFIKRFGFRDEREFRIIYESKTASLSTKSVPIPLSCIDRIIFSYKLDYSIYRALRSELRSLDGCEELNIQRSRLTDSKTWRAAGEKLVQNARGISTSTP